MVFEWFDDFIVSLLSVENIKEWLRALVKAPALDGPWQRPISFSLQGRNGVAA